MTLKIRPGFEQWDPSLISTALWLDAADASTVFTTDTGSTLATNGSAVGRWNDKSGNGRNFAQSTTADRPAFTASGLNSKTVMSFDGGDLLTASFSLAVTSESVFVVLKYASASSGFARIFSQSDSGNDYDNTGHYIPLIRDAATASLASYATANSRSLISLAYDTWGIAGSIHTGSQITNYINAASGSNYSHTLSKTFTRFALGAQFVPPPGGFLNGSIAEVVLLPTAATETQRQRIEGYLAHKWGLTANLPSDHPYKTNAPAP